MKTLTFTLVAAFLFSCNSTQKVAETTTSDSSTVVENTGTPTPPVGIPPAHNKEFVKNYFDETYNNILFATNGLTDEQLNFKASPENGRFWNVWNTSSSPSRCCLNMKKKLCLNQLHLKKEVNLNSRTMTL